MTDGRIPRLTPDELDDEQRAVYDAVAGGRRAQGPQLFRLVADDGSLEGPFNAFLLQPRLGMALQALGSTVRYETALSDRDREIAILVVADHADSSFEWYAHEAVARHVGLDDAELRALRDRRFDLLATEREEAVARTTWLLAEHGDLDDDQYAVAVDALGDARFFELLTLVGYYSALALQMRVYRVARPDAGS